jgi:hypothetical protein
VLAEFEHTTMPHFLAHCAAVCLVVFGVVALVAGETPTTAAQLVAAGGSKGGAPNTPRSAAAAAVRGPTLRARPGATASAKHNV